MSSHHFVKEGQEPALLILNALRPELVMPLLEWAPRVVVSASAVEAVAAWGIKIDEIIAVDLETEMFAHLLNQQMPFKIIPSAEGKSIAENALSHLVTSGEHAVNVIAVSVDDGLFAEVDLYHDKLQICLWDEQTKWMAVRNGKFEKWLPAGTTLQIRKNESQPIQLQGLTTKDNLFENKDSGLVSIRSEHRFWVGEWHNS